MYHFISYHSNQTGQINQDVVSRRVTYSFKTELEDGNLRIRSYLRLLRVDSQVINVQSSRTRC